MHLCNKGIDAAIAGREMCLQVFILPSECVKVKHKRFAGNYRCAEAMWRIAVRGACARRAEKEKPVCVPRIPNTSPERYVLVHGRIG